jgi:hypothetical protein
MWLKKTNKKTKWMTQDDKTWLKRIRGTRGYMLLSTFIKSAAVGLLFAVLCFVYDIYHDSEQDKQLEESVDKLAKIEQSLSTRYLGIFPTYIEDICAIFEDLNPLDTIVIFEDVLYYGIKSRPKEFFYLNAHLFDHVLNGGCVTIAYYDFVKTERPSSLDVFHKMIVESRIDSKYHTIMRESRVKEFRRIKGDPQRDVLMRRFDSTLCEQYFSSTRDDDLDKFKFDIKAYLSTDLIDVALPNPAPKADLLAHQMCVEIDEVKHHYLGNKPVGDILFWDYEQMYRQMSEIIVKYYNKVGIDLIPLNEYLTMSCWMVKKSNRKDVKTVLAFPSKYSTDEIGFYSQDEAFSRYIGAMLDGVRRNRRWGQDE